MTRVFVALGSNLGDRHGHLAFARDRLAALPDTTLLAESPIEETMPLAGRDQPLYLNQMVALETALSPDRLLKHCTAIEVAAGRRPEDKGRGRSRTLDLDIVRYGAVCLEGPDLVLPHPGVADRPFWRRELDQLEAVLDGRSGRV